MGVVRTADVFFVLSNSEVLVMFVTSDCEHPTSNISERNKIRKVEGSEWRNTNVGISVDLREVFRKKYSFDVFIIETKTSDGFHGTVQTTWFQIQEILHFFFQIFNETKI